MNQDQEIDQLKEKIHELDQDNISLKAILESSKTRKGGSYIPQGTPQIESKEVESLKREIDVLRNQVTDDQKIKDLYELYKQILNTLLSKGGTYNDTGL